jgi:glycosyltransferase involved in cell wall biosynthesis
MILLSSFPRSGNTFLRNILFEVYGMESSEFHRMTDQYLDDDFRTYPFVKTHDLPSVLHEFDAGIPAVYLVRDGRDSVCSMAHHRSDLVAPGSDYLQNLKEAIIAAKGSFFGGWSRNAEEWLERADLIIRFEDLIRDPINTVENLRKICELPAPIVENLPTFESLKFGIPKYGHGMNSNFSEKEKLRQSGKFFRKGKTGGWKKDMPDDLHDLFWSYHGETMENFGYARNGELRDLNPVFDHVLKAKLGFAKESKAKKKYKVLIESNKIFSPVNDGVKRYQVELLKSLLPVVENPDSSWEIDLYVHQKISPLLDFKDVLLHGFLPDQETCNSPTRLSSELLTAEQKLVAIVPKDFVAFLARNNINIFHTTYNFFQRSLNRLITLVRSRKNIEKATAQTNLPTSETEIKLESYDLVHIPLQQNYVPFLKAQNDMVITIHDLTHLHFPDFHTQENIFNADEGMKFAIDRQAHLIAVSEATKDDVLENTPIVESKVHRIYEAADQKKFNPKIDSEDCRKVGRKYLIDTATPYIICLSTIEPRKNLLNTIRAYILLRQENPAIRLKLIIAGKKGWDTNSIFSMAKDYHDHILFTGFVDDDDLAYLYSEAVAMSYVSFYEGFGLPPLEAMSCGTPVIYGNNSSLIEVVGDGGLPADPNDVNDIKTQFERIFFDTELRERKARAALKQSFRFSWRDTGIETLNLYKRIIDDKRELPSTADLEQQETNRRNSSIQLR